jgi:flagellar basal body-associated protein FliL
MEEDMKRSEDIFNTSLSGEAAEKDPVFLAPLIGVVIVLLALALIGLFLWGSARASAEAHREGLFAKPFVQQ